MKIYLEVLEDRVLLIYLHGQYLLATQLYYSIIPYFRQFRL